MRTLSATLLVLLPEKGDVENLKDYKPIILVGKPIYFAKVLANRLKRVMGKVISENQNAFVKNRLNGCLFDSNEAIDSKLHSGNNGISFKSNTRKVLDHVNFFFIGNQQDIHNTSPHTLGVYSRFDC